MQDIKKLGRKGLHSLEEAVSHLDDRAGLVDEAATGLCGEIEDEVKAWNADLLKLISDEGAAGKVYPTVRRVEFSIWNDLDFPYLLGISPMLGNEDGSLPVSSRQLMAFERFMQRYNNHMLARFQETLNRLRSEQCKAYGCLLEASLVEKISSSPKADKALFFVHDPEDGIVRADWDLYNSALSSVCITGIRKAGFFAMRRMRKDAGSLKADAYIVKNMSSRLSGRILLTYAAGIIQGEYEAKNPEVAASRSTMRAWSTQGVTKAAVWTAEDLVRKYSGRDIVREIYFNECPGCDMKMRCLLYQVGDGRHAGKEPITSEDSICRIKQGLPN